MRDRNLLIGTVLICAVLFAGILAVTSQPDEHSVIYDGNGGDCSAADPEMYREGDTVSVVFDPVPEKANHVFLGWSQDPSAEFPEFLADSGEQTFEMGGSDVVLYAVYSADMYMAQPGSTFDYKVTETWRNFPDYICIMNVTAEVISNDGENMVFHVTGTQYVKDGDAEDTAEVDRMFDTAVDYWGYNMGELEILKEYPSEYRLFGETVPVYVVEYDGIDYYEKCRDVIGYYDEILYLSEYECPRDDGDLFRNVTELTGFRIVA